MKTFYYILKSSLVGLLLYALVGVLMAFVMVTFFGNDHPHSIDEILYFVVPIFMGIVGAFLGLVFAIITMGDYSFTKVKKYLLVCSPIIILIGMLFLIYG
ncbi:hypothetical protein [Aquimarina sp. 2304DJ70-9]|uniref:hypothetical protein n=1 Tax=Aquimarina penaris TaxID=3231044 RepID=UPI0034622C4D